MSMESESKDISLKGCAPVPLAHYLKALGVFRTVAEQVDPSAKCYWMGDSFRLRTTMNGESLEEFFLERYKPTPIVAPWNGGSGFYYQEEKLKEKDPQTGKLKKTGRRILENSATKAAKDILKSTTERLSEYRKALQTTKEIIEKMKLEEAPTKGKKEELIQSVRNRLPDHAIDWLDASVILTAENARFPPLLGTGGNDGNLDFSSNFMQRLKDVFDFISGKSDSFSKKWLKGALYSENLDGLRSGISIGQFYPGAAGGPNSAPGFSTDTLVNPWDYILMIEGALFFASAIVKRLQTNMPGVMSYPFSVHPSGVGYGSASESDEKSARAEIWMPLWEKPTGLSELKALMGEGRAQVGRRPAKNGVDFARAVATLGVDRGIKSFQRYGFLARNGKNFFSVPLERVLVSRQIQVELLNDVDLWLDFFQDKARSEKAPASVRNALNMLESSILALCKESNNDRSQAWRVQDVLIALGECEKSIVRSSRWARDANVKPVSPLSNNWLEKSNDQSPEFILAACLAFTYARYEEKDGREFTMWLRSQMEPVDHWSANSFNQTLERDVVWSDGDPISVMNEMISRRIMMAVRSGKKSYPDRSKIVARLGDIADFIEGRVDLTRMMDLLWGLILLDRRGISEDLMKLQFNPDAVSPPASYAMLKLCFAGALVCNEEVPLVPEIHHRAATGNGFGAMQLAERRLRGSNLPVANISTKLSSDLAKRIAAALIFSIGENQIDKLAKGVLKKNAMQDDELVKH